MPLKSLENFISISGPVIPFVTYAVNLLRKPCFHTLIKANFQINALCSCSHQLCQHGLTSLPSKHEREADPRGLCE